MSGSVNKVTILGHLARDPEVKSFANGGKVCNMTVATSERWKDKQSGDMKEVSQFHNVAIFNERLAEVAERFLKKGSQVYLEGQLETRSWEKNGEKRYSTEVVLRQFHGELTLLGKEGDAGSSGQTPHNAAKANGYAPQGSVDLDDEIPF